MSKIGGLILALMFLSWSIPPLWATPPATLRVEYFPFQLDSEEADRKTFDGLELLAAFELSSDDSRFGGLSGLELSDDGETLYAVSDHGYWLSAGLHHDARSRLIHFGPWKIAPILGSDGKVVSRRLRDAEALVKDIDGSLIASFERVHRLWRYPPPPKAFSSPPRSIPHPPGLEGAPNNGGAEAVGILADGNLLLLTERYKNDDGNFKGWLLRGKQFFQLSYLQSDGFNPTDLAALAGGDMLLLERRYNRLWGASMRIRRLSRESLKPGARLKGKEVALFEPPLAIDNFEGLAVREDPKIGTLLYIISDDNYNPLQRTLLLQFQLLPEDS